jgi:acyl carrier protein
MGAPACPLGDLTAHNFRSAHFNGRTSNMNDENLPRVKSAFHLAFDIDPTSITIETKPGDIPPWDSMGHVALVSSLEREFGMRFDVDEVMEMEDVSAILRIVATKRAKMAT